MGENELVDKIAEASWDAADGFVTGIPWPPSSAFRARKEQRRARAMIAAYRGDAWYVDQEIEWNPTGDEWKTGFITTLDGDHAAIVLHENAQRLVVQTRHLRARRPSAQSTPEASA